MQISGSHFTNLPTSLADARTTQGQRDSDENLNAANQLLDNHASNEAAPKDELKEAFTDFVGQTLFGQMMKSMRTTVGKPAYFHGGRTEEIFQEQLDNIMTEDLTKSTASSYADPMYELFQLNRK